MNTNRPVNLDLTTVKFPITAIVSILHRITGVALLAGILILMWMLDASLSSQESFDSLRELLDKVWAKFILWLVLVATAYHLAAGIKHLIMDMGIGESLEGGKRGATITLVVAVLLSVLAGVWLW